MEKQTNAQTPLKTLPERPRSAWVNPGVLALYIVRRRNVTGLISQLRGE